MSDARLARRAAGGDREALGVIYQRHHRGMYRVCRSVLRDADDAQDALQNAMARVMRALPGEERELALRPWLHRIARNEALRVLHSRRPQSRLDELDELPAADHGTEARERLAALAVDLRELSERQRIAIVLRELEGAAFCDIAGALDISEPAARQMVHEARASLIDFERGRAMACTEVTRALSDGDGRRLRQRRLRAHLRDCGGCRAFRSALGTRRQDLRLLFPPLVPAAAASVLSDALAAGSGGVAAGGAGGGTLSALGGAVGGGALAGASLPALAAKGLAALAVAGGVGAGAVAATGEPDREPGGLRAGTPAHVAQQPLASPGAPGQPHGAARPAGDGADARGDGHGRGRVESQVGEEGRGRAGAAGDARARTDRGRTPQIPVGDRRPSRPVAGDARRPATSTTPAAGRAPGGRAQGPAPGTTTRPVATTPAHAPVQRPAAPTGPAPVSSPAPAPGATEPPATVPSVDAPTREDRRR